MRRFQQAVFGLVIAALVSGSAFAADKPKKEKKAKPAPMPGVQAALNLVRGLELSDEQKEKVKEIGTSFNEKFAALKAKQESGLSEEAKKARQEAMKKAKAEGKKGKELQEAINAAAPVSEEQKAAQKASRQEQQAVMKELKDALLGVLTEDQRMKLQQAKPKREKKNKDAA